jgi:hypothetical protein
MAHVAKMPLSKPHGLSNLRYARPVRSQGIAKKLSTKASEWTERRINKIIKGSAARAFQGCRPQAPSDVDPKPHVPHLLTRNL